MKKLLLSFFIVLAFASHSGAQAVDVFPIAAADDTLTTARTAFAGPIALRGYNPIMSVQCTVTRTAGAMTGSLELQVANTLAGPYVTCPGTSAFSITDAASRSIVWSASPGQYKYYRVSITNATGSFAPVSKYYHGGRAQQ